MEIERAALAGLKVLELSHSVPAAYCGRQFALWGADVAVVEPEQGSPLRAMSPRVRGASGAQHSLLWAYVAANKRTVLRSALSRPSIFHELLAGTDVLIVDRDEDGLAELGMS
jgi:crotonobetainyl-CoA:carnitine CoA-transferase CaiB-like acyl-CoA transferase